MRSGSALWLASMSDRRPTREERRLRLLDDKPAGSLVVHEIYRSLQGESVHAGRPCAFVRLAACDLRCRWCDTPHAFHQGRAMSLEAVVAEVVQPSETLVAPRVPPIPPTISRAHASVTFRASGDADVKIEGESSDSTQAEADAAALTEAIDEATTMKISVIKIRAFEPIEFRADGDRVAADRRVTKQELDSLLGLVEMLSN